MNHSFILSRRNNSYIQSLSANICNTTIINDCDYTDQSCIDSGFNKLTHTVKSPCAWDKAFLYIYTNWDKLKDVDYFYFIEDDVYTSDPQTFVDLISEASDLNYDLLSHWITSKPDFIKWPHWKQSPSHIKNPFRSFNPFCRISNRLMVKILDERKEYNRFWYNEIMFISLAKQSNFKVCNWNNTSLSKYFGKFQYRPVISLANIHDNKIYHPVKLMNTIIIGLGTGRCGTTSLATLLSLQEDSDITHETKDPKWKFLVSWEKNDQDLKKIVNFIENKKTKFRGDVAFWYLPYVEDLIKIYPDIKFVVIERDKEEVIESYLNWVKSPRNHWSKKPPEPYQKCKWDKCYPKFAGDKRIALTKYINYYKSEVNRLSQLYRDKFKVINMTDLNDYDKVKDLLTFCGYTNKNIIANVRRNDQIYSQ